MIISPIIDWTDDEVWTFLNTLGVAHCELYDQGWRRIGCIGCPMSSKKQKKLENKRWPHVKRNWIKAIKEIRKNGGLRKGIFLVEHQSRPISTKENDNGFSDCSSFDRLTEEQENEIAENIYDWWISGKKYEKWYAEKFLQQHFNFDEQ